MTDQTPIERLESGVAELRVPAPKADREALLLGGGFAAAILGAVLIMLAWYGASGTRDVTDQVPYLISGGLLGLALVVAGTGVVMRYSLARLFRFWLARLLAEHQVQTDRTVDALGRIEALLAGRAPAAPGASATASEPASAEA